MTKDEIKQKLEVFKDFKFFEEDHHYEFKGQKVGISVTRLIEEYTNEFNAEEAAERVSSKNGKSVNEILKEWNINNQQACEKGHLGHEYAQKLWGGIFYQVNTKNLSEATKIALEKVIQQAKNFYDDYKDNYDLIAIELIVGDEDSDCASAIDLLLYNKLTGKLALVDIKTNSYITGYNKEPYKKKMKVPLHHLNDDAYNHYCLQLSIYKHWLEKYPKLEVDEMFIVYFSENIENYEIIEIPYLKDEVIKILENRKVKNMNSVPILLIGKSGSGKSTSLRNFKKEEVAVVNVLGKPLPFKSDINAPKCDDYNIIINSIKQTDKKVIVIDDAGYLITNEFMKTSSIKGYDKFNNMANNFWNLVNEIKNIEGGKTIYLIMHEDIDDLQNIKPKTIGHLLDEKVDIQGMFTVCIRSVYEDGKYLFKLKTNGQDCVKTPFDMITKTEMENDLKAFDNIVREYYELDKKDDK